jgi:ribosomal protein S18 acetylase RimI-like enzyme
VAIAGRPRLALELVRGVASQEQGPATQAGAFLASIAVAPSARGAGLGRRLLQEFEEQARARGADCLRLEVEAEAAAALALYESRGFRPIAGAPGSGSPPMRWMELPLTARGVAP